jgi:dihydrofolate reductase
VVNRGVIRIKRKVWKAIAAMSANRIIGNGNKLPWDIPLETEWFRKTTEGQLLIVGRKTYESIKHKNPESIYVVLTKNKRLASKGNVIYINTIEQIDSILTNKQIWVCGGANIYEQTLHRCDELFLSIIKEDYSGDCKFPLFEKYFVFNKKIIEHVNFETLHYLNKGV